MYRKFTYQPALTEPTGWDAYATTYATLLQPGTIYHLTKEVIHRQIDAVVPAGRPLRVLDLNCGVGNDFPFFLARGWQITGCDGSVGMLNQAWETYHAEIAAGRISLYQGQMETLDPGSFPGEKFDLIYSVTGGYSYIADDIARSVNAVLGLYLAPGGVMVTAHLNRLCLSDTVYHLLHVRIKPAFLRWRSFLRITIKGRELLMHLRGPGRSRRLLPPTLQTVEVWPLLWLTPPYQTGCRPPRWLYRLLRRLELATCGFSWLAGIADQVVVIARHRDVASRPAPAATISPAMDPPPSSHAGTGRAKESLPSPHA